MALDHAGIALASGWFGLDPSAYSERLRAEIMGKIETIMQEEGVVIQPYWRSLYRHTKKTVHDCEMHATFEHHHYKWWISA